MTLNDQIKTAVEEFDVDPTAIGRVVDAMRFTHRMNYNQVCAAILQVCPGIDVEEMLYACDEAEANGD